MKKNLLVLAIAVLLIGCSKFEEPPSDTPIRESKTRSALAAQDNPYSLTNSLGHLSPLAGTLCIHLHAYNSKIKTDTLLRPFLA